MTPPLLDGLPQDNALRRPLALAAEGLSGGWIKLAQDFFAGATGQALCQRVDERVAAGVAVYPSDPLRALRGVAPERVRVVIVGQDPYHGPGEAEGLAFSVPAGVRIPPSLRNIRKELAADLAVPLPDSGSLAAWVSGGVLLLNTSLTVERDRPASHARWGWEPFTDDVIAEVVDKAPACVFMLWGAHAQAKAPLVERCGAGRHAVLKSNHPSPLAASRPPVPFLGSRPFSAANTHLMRHGVEPVDWRLLR